MDIAGTRSLSRVSEKIYERIIVIGRDASVLGGGPAAQHFAAGLMARYTTPAFRRQPERIGLASRSFATGIQARVTRFMAGRRLDPCGTTALNRLWYRADASVSERMRWVAARVAEQMRFVTARSLRRHRLNAGEPIFRMATSRPAEALDARANPPRFLRPALRLDQSDPIANRIPSDRRLPGSELPQTRQPGETATGASGLPRPLLWLRKETRLRKQGSGRAGAGSCAVVPAIRQRRFSGGRTDVRAGAGTGAVDSRGAGGAKRRNCS